MDLRAVSFESVYYVVGRCPKLEIQKIPERVVEFFVVARCFQRGFEACRRRFLVSSALVVETCAVEICVIRFLVFKSLCEFVELTCRVVIIVSAVEKCLSDVGYDLIFDVQLNILFVG